MLTSKLRFLNLTCKGSGMGGRKTAKSSGLHIGDGLRENEDKMKGRRQKNVFSTIRLTVRVNAPPEAPPAIFWSRYLCHV